MDSREMFPKRCKIALGDVGTSSSSSISKNDYEVFLSFRGPDTRQGFTDCIYHALIDSGIVIFRDDDELRPGDKIDEILTALDNSKICIVVLSPTFAESAWCLREVERMVDMKKDIVPIFYYVTPDDVKLKTELYANALIMHEIKYGKEQVQQWRNALKAIPTIKGRELKNTGYIEFSRQIAKDVLMTLKVKNKYEIKNLVELPNEVEAALKLLDIGSGGRRFVGIHGMGGIGKTTLAKIIFNQIYDRFDCSCFLENIRDYSSQGPEGLYKLQERLLKSLGPSMQDIVDPMKWIQTTFRRKKVFIVLDDVDQQSQLDSLVGDSSWFGNGSRIMFTTRNAELHEQGTSIDAPFYGLEKKEMDPAQALKLFSRHAFGEDSPPKDFQSLSAEAISTTGGLPLALEVVGSLLHRRKVKVWREMIKKLKEAPHQDVQRKLKLSYDALDDEQQEIFLDIACFFIHEEKSNAVNMWEACEFDPNYGIEVLIVMSLIKLNEKKCFWMHDQLRDLGRAIVKVNSKDARAGSRLWMHKDALDLLKTNVGKEKVEALHLDGPSGYLDRENFVGLENLRFLRLTKYAHFGGDFDDLIPKLRWLSLKLDASSFNISNLCLRELVVLELKCRFDENWQGWGQILISKQLQVLILSHCHELISTPDLSKIVNLERLVLKKCDKLTSIHTSIRKLQCLRRLSITECMSLHELPEELTSLESLKQILFSYSPKYVNRVMLNLPESIGRLVSLTRLELWCVVKLPSSIGELVKLKHLSLRKSTSLKVLPDSIGDLSSLIHLDLSYSGITELPTTIGRLAKLESLCLSVCECLQRLPDSVGSLHSLIDLDMSHSSIAELPHSLGNLVSLQKLHLRNSRVTSLPDSFRGLEKLEWLDIGDSVDFRGFGSSRCWIQELHELPSELTRLYVGSVQKIQNLSNLTNLYELGIVNPDWCSALSAHPLVLEGIEKLIKLDRLIIKCFSVQFLSLNWGALQQLKSLELHCHELEFRQCQLPCSLESLDLDVKKWGLMPINFSGMKNLSKLKLCNFVIEETDLVQGLESLEVVEMRDCILKFNNFPVLTRLRQLNLRRCQSHIAASPPVDDDLEDGKSIIGSEVQIVLSNLKNLWRLELASDAVWGQEPSGLQIELSNLKNLSSLVLTYFSIHDDGFKVQGLESLQRLQMHNCIIYEFGNVSVFKSLRTLYLDKCSFPRVTCLHISQLNCLVELNLDGCKGLVDIRGIGKLKSLTQLYIQDCDSMQRIEDLSELNQLTKIWINQCRVFEGIDGDVDKLLSSGTLSDLLIKDCKCNNMRYPERASTPTAQSDADCARLRQIIKSLQ